MIIPKFEEGQSSYSLLIKGERKELVKGGLFRVGEKDIQTLITFLSEKGEDMSHSLVSLKIKHSTNNKTRLVSLTIDTILITLRCSMPKY